MNPVKSQNKEIVTTLQAVRNNLSEQMNPQAEPGLETQKPTRKPTKVMFDKSSGAPFEVVFSERGFLIEDTRMSFEEIETAISKNYNIVLNGGKGLTLDAVKMQKILKYKGLY
jgi:hypothetical protein